MSAAHEEGASWLRRQIGLAGVAGRPVVVITHRGVEIPIADTPKAWTVVELARLLAEIELLPEVEHPLGRF